MYQVYKLVRSINRTYPNNGVINQVMIDENSVLDEDLRDLINETLHESYKEMELDEIFSFPLVAGQNEYQLPSDCDTSQVQEVTRTYTTWARPMEFIKPIEEIVNEDHDPQPDDVIPPFSRMSLPMSPETQNYYNGGVYPPEHYMKKEHERYLGWLPNHYNKGITRRLVWARDAEELTGDRYYNAWGTDRIGIYPTPNRGGDIINIYYKKKPKDILLMTDDIQIKDKYMPIIVYGVCMKLAMMGNKPDINMYNVFASKRDELTLEAKREKNSDMPFYQHIKDNDRPSAFMRRRRGWRR